MPGRHCQQIRFPKKTKRPPVRPAAPDIIVRTQRLPAPCATLPTTPAYGLPTAQDARRETTRPNSLRAKGRFPFHGRSAKAYSQGTGFTALNSLSLAHRMLQLGKKPAWIADKRHLRQESAGHCDWCARTEGPPVPVPVPVSADSKAAAKYAAAGQPGRSAALRQPP